MNIQNIEFPKITLVWSEWFAWEKFYLDERTESEAIKVPDLSGVYEVRRKDSDDRLTIGKTLNLRKRIIRGLVKGKIPHSSGNRIRNMERDLSLLEIRWAETNKPSAVEEELHKQYVKKFGGLPTYTKKT